ncbi:hypothetical protein ACFX10_013401 [Malus domestica]
MLGTRLSDCVLLEFEPEIEKRLREIHKEQKKGSEKENWQENKMALVQNETMGDLDIPTILQSKSSIVLPVVVRNYELKNKHFNMMPSFHGISIKDPLAHIRDIFNLVSNMALTEGVIKEHLRMKVFPYTMKDKVKTWLNSLKPGTLTS